MEQHDALGDLLGIRLLVQRDDLLPFPMGGNKVRKLKAELASVAKPDLVISNGGVRSNHCRTLAFLGARRGIDVHLVLHGATREDRKAGSIRTLIDLGAKVTVVEPSDIASSIEQLKAAAVMRGERVHVIAGGCHTPAGALASRQAAEDVIATYSPSFIVLASGTGATQGGIVAAALVVNGNCMVTGISVARFEERGTEAVREAAQWAGANGEFEITFLDEYLDGGYERHGSRTESAMSMGWAHGLPLDPTYTGKAFAGLIDLVKTRRIPQGSEVLFWHTGGLANYLDSNRNWR